MDIDKAAQDAIQELSTVNATKEGIINFVNGPSGYREYCDGHERH